MNRHLHLVTIAAMSCATMTFAQNPRPAAKPPAPTASRPSASLPSDLETVIDAQGQAVEQAKQALAESEDPTVHGALETALKAMQKAQTALDAAKNSPDKLGP